MHVLIAGNAWFIKTSMVYENMENEVEYDMVICLTYDGAIGHDF